MAPFFALAMLLGAVVHGGNVPCNDGSTIRAEVTVAFGHLQKDEIDEVIPAKAIADAASHVFEITNDVRLILSETASYQQVPLVPDQLVHHVLSKPAMRLWGSMHNLGFDAPELGGEEKRRVVVLFTGSLSPDSVFTEDFVSTLERLQLSPVFVLRAGADADDFRESMTLAQMCGAVLSVEGDFDTALRRSLAEAMCVCYRPAPVSVDFDPLVPSERRLGGSNCFGGPRPRGLALHIEDRDLLRNPKVMFKKPRPPVAEGERDLILNPAALFGADPRELLGNDMEPRQLEEHSYPSDKPRPTSTTTSTTSTRHDHHHHHGDDCCCCCCCCCNCGCGGGGHPMPPYYRTTTTTTTRAANATRTTEKTTESTTLPRPGSSPESTTTEKEPPAPTKPHPPLPPTEDSPTEPPMVTPTLPPTEDSPTEPPMEMPTSTAELSCKDLYSMEVLFIQDNTYSFREDLPNLRERVPRLLDKLWGQCPTLRFGLVTFVDKSAEPFGLPGVDYCYYLHTALGQDRDRIARELNSLQYRSGRDWKENQLSVLQHISLASDIGWTPARTRAGRTTLRVAIVSTDAGYHTAGDTALHGYPWPPNNGDEVMDCQGEDYPTVEQVREAMVLGEVHPIFLVTKPVVALYEDLGRSIAPMGRYVVEEVTGDSSDIDSAIMEGLNDLCKIMMS